MVRKCAVPECLSEEGRDEDRGVTFHKIPLHSDIRPKWMSLCHIPEDKYNIKVIHVCSRHFLKADFCHFKGKKYMLRQGVLPSVFPWNKLKREYNPNISPIVKKELVVENANNSEKNNSTCKETMQIKEEVKLEIKDEPLDPIDVRERVQGASSSLYILNTADDTMLNVKNECVQSSSTIEQRGKSVQTSTGLLNFSINTRLEALDFNQMWLPARIIEIDYEEDEVLIHFEKSSSKYDEWISMSSSRLRSLQTATKKNMETFAVGENCMALWSDTRKFPACVTKIIEKDTYEVLFNDGYIKVLKGHKLSKVNTKPGASAPLFDPVKGSKQDRRDKKRKLNVSELFRKRSKADTPDESTVIETSEEGEVWLPKWEQGRPVGVESTIETSDGPKKSVIVSDPALPPDWQKHLVQKSPSGKWECIILSPDGKKIHNKSDVKSYLEENVHLKYSEKIFNFNVYNRPGKNNRRVTQSSNSSPAIPATPAESNLDTDTSSSLKIPFIEDAYMCPIEGCGKSFRRVNLAQMHVKHYHPEFIKFLDCTPNVADLAYARTVGESLDKSPERVIKTPVRQVQKNVTSKSNTPKGSPSVPIESSSASLPPVPPDSKTKDSEIIKLLNHKSNEENLPKYPPGLPSNMYPDIKLKDLLNKSEAIPKREDINLKSMSGCTTRPTGIKTLLPVVRSAEIKKEVTTDTAELIDQESLTKPNGNKPHFKQLKRKRQVSEIVESVRKDKLESAKEIPILADLPKEPQTNPDYIVEGGEVIKIVRMKREEIINCTCGVTEEDGLMIQCEVCLCWQHAYCNNIERENQVPEKYVCYICQNPARQRTSRKYFHDQDWLKTGTLPVANYHCKDNEVLKKRFEKLKKVHDLSGGLLELKDFMHSLKVKIKIAQAKNHPKLYLWSKPWEKELLPEKQELKDEDEKPKPSTDNLSLLELATDNKNDLSLPIKSESSNMLLSFLKTKDEELSSLSKLDFNTLDDIPISAPQPEAAIESADCQLNLLEHIAHSQNLVEERLKSIEEQVDVLDPDNVNTEEDYKRTCQTVQMLLRDLGILKELCYTNVL